jgi:hypothetical protein
MWLIAVGRFAEVAAFFLTRLVSTKYIKCSSFQENPESKLEPSTNFNGLKTLSSVPSVIIR